MWLNALIVTLISIACVASAQSKDLHELVSGALPQKASVLGPDSYVPLKMKKLAHGGVLYVDLDWLREQGFEVPHEGLTPAFEAKVLDVLGWAAPAEGEPAGTYTDATATSYADRYGGFGIGFPGAQNGGSGRAASRGLLQCKGCGRTELVHPSIDVYHSSGTAALDEGIAEVVASQVAHRELPHGANRVVALISVGTWTSINGGRSVDPRVLIFREDPIRPAHFMANETATGTEIETRRMNWMAKKLVSELPQKAGEHFQSDSDRLRKGVTEMIERLADVLAFSYARGFHHGAITPSNMELDGKAIDFGTFTQYQGYPLGVSVEWIGPFGDNTSVHWFLRDFERDLAPLLPTSLRQGLMSAEDLQHLFDQVYERRLNLQFSLLTGFPAELMDGVPADRVQVLGRTLLEIAQAGNSEMIKTLWKDPGQTGTYQIPKILASMGTALATASPRASIEKVLNKAATSAGLTDAPLRTRLIDAYRSVFRSVEASARRESISERSLKTYTALAAKIRNHKIDELSRGDKFWQVYEPLISQFHTDLRPEPIRAKLMEQLQTSRRSYRDAKPFTLVLQSTSDVDGSEIREVFDLRTGRRSNERWSPTRTRDDREQSASSALKAPSTTAPRICRDLFVAH